MNMLFSKQKTLSIIGYLSDHDQRIKSKNNNRHKIEK